MQIDGFNTWLYKLVSIWQDRKPEKIVDICAKNFVWYEKPFDEPIVTKDTLIEEWKSVLKQKDISVSYRVLSINDYTCMAHWSASFASTMSNDKFVLDGIWKFILDNDGKCTEFRQWYMAKE